MEVKSTGNHLGTRSRLSARRHSKHWAPWSTRAIWLVLLLPALFASLHYVFVLYSSHTEPTWFLFPIGSDLAPHFHSLRLSLEDVSQARVCIGRLGHQLNNSPQELSTSHIRAEVMKQDMFLSSRQSKLTQFVADTVNRTDIISRSIPRDHRHVSSGVMCDLVSETVRHLRAISSVSHLEERAIYMFQRQRQQGIEALLCDDYYKCGTASLEPCAAAMTCAPNYPYKSGVNEQRVGILEWIGTTTRTTNKVVGDLKEGYAKISEASEDTGRAWSKSWARICTDRPTSSPAWKSQDLLDLFHDLVTISESAKSVERIPDPDTHAKCATASENRHYVSQYLAQRPQAWDFSLKGVWNSARWLFGGK